VADLIGAKEGDNPHIWYDPRTMPAVADKLVTALSSRVGQDKNEFLSHAQGFRAAMKPVLDQIADIKSAHGGTTVTATEPVFGYMAQALGFKMRNEPFQIAMMNGTEPSASEVADFEADLRDRKVRVLFYNNQVTDDLTSRLQKLARESKVPVVGVSETEPLGTNFQDWMLNQLVALDNALASDGL
jgi:zinc/manganese transport system substrate-binding protein